MPTTRQRRTTEIRALQHLRPKVSDITMLASTPARNPKTCMQKVVEYLTGNNLGEACELGATAPHLLLRETFFTRPQALTFLCYLKLVALKFPSMRYRVEDCLDLIGYNQEDLVACEKWSRSVEPLVKAQSVMDVFFGLPPHVHGQITQWVAYGCVRKPAPRQLSGLVGDEFRHPAESGLFKTIVDGNPDLFALSYGIASARSAVEMNHLKQNAIQVTERSMPKLAECWGFVCQAMALESAPALYVSSFRNNLATIGLASPIVVIPSSMVSNFDERELMFLLGRELGRILCEHQRMLYTIDSIQSGADRLQVGFVAKGVTAVTVQRWMRVTELTCDRAGLLACQSPEIVDRVLLKLMGYPLKYSREMPSWLLRELVQQHSEYCEQGSLRSLSDQALTWTSNVCSRRFPILYRASALHEWFDTGEFCRVLRRVGAASCSQQLEDLITPRIRRDDSNEKLLSRMGL